MKIGLLGYGKMGKVIEQVALQRGHDIVLKVDEHTTSYDISLTDVAIDFSVPSAAVNNISNCLEKGIPVISGTTGWLKDYDTIIDLCLEKKGAFIYASNFSLGVNIFFELNKNLAKMMKSLSQYNVSLEEIHHNQKLDAPSGTAITLAEGIIEQSNYKNWKLEATKEANEIPIKAKRIDNISGIHSVNYESKVDSINITHKAHNRDGFALGAVIAAEWLLDKKGVFTMNDVLNIS
jgi:4-hydroxy-tetrahydrodipicolinate reductase